MTSTDSRTVRVHTERTEHAERADPKGMRVVWLLLVAVFVAILNETTMGIAIPVLNQDLGLPPELGQWLTSAFMLTMAIVIPTTGFVLQRLTTRQVFLAAMSAFSLGTLLCVVAPGFAFLLLGRVVQAIGTGVMMPLLMTTIMDVAPVRSRGRIMGRASLVIALAPAIGPTLSGAVLDSLGWRWLFRIILPIALLALLAGARWMTNLGETVRTPIDGLSIVASAFAFGGIVFGLSQFGGGNAGSSGSQMSAFTIGTISLAVGGVMLGLFAWRQLALQRHDRALLDLRVFRSGIFTFSVATMAILALSMFGTLTLLPQYLQNVVGLNPLQSGAILLPGSILMGVLGPVMGRWYDAQGPKPLLIPGSILVAASLLYYSTVTQNTPWWTLMLVQTAMSVGMAMSFTPLFSASLGSLPRHLYSHGSAVLGTLQQVAGAAGVAILIAIYSAALHNGTREGASIAVAGAAGARSAFLVASLVSLVAVALSLFVRTPQEADENPAEAAH